MRNKHGLRGEKPSTLDNTVLTLRGRADWAHDFGPERPASVTFQSLPGASLMVNGADPGANAALTAPNSNGISP